MKPDNETIEEFQKAYFEEFGEEISRQEAYEKFLRLTNVLRAILRPDGNEKNREGQGKDSPVPTPVP